MTPEERRLEILRLEKEAADRADKLAMARNPNAAAAALILGLPASAFVRDAAPHEAATARRSRGLGDPRARFMDALATLRGRDGRLTKRAVATEMGVDPGTLNGYMASGIVPP
jgi:hypothetical protein